MIFTHSDNAVFYNGLKNQPHESSSVNEVVLRASGKAGRFGGEKHVCREGDDRLIMHLTAGKSHYCFLPGDNEMLYCFTGPDYSE